MGTIYFELFKEMITINIMVIGIFIVLGYWNLKFLIVIMKSMIRILLTVWVVLMVQFSTMTSIEQSVWMILSAFFFVYLEVLLDINDCLFQVNEDFRVPKINFITAKLIKENSVAISILCLSVINTVLS